MPARSAIRAISRTEGQLNVVRSSARVGRAPPPTLAKNTPSLSVFWLNSGFADRTALPLTFTTLGESNRRRAARGGVVRGRLYPGDRPDVNREVRLRAAECLPGGRPARQRQALLDRHAFIPMLRNDPLACAAI